MISLLDALARHPEPVNLKQLATETELHPSTAHRILSVMVQNRVVERIEPGTYRLGIRLLELGTLVRSRSGVPVAAMACMPNIRAQSAERSDSSRHQDNEVASVAPAPAPKS